MTKKNQILVPIGGTPVRRFGLEFRAIPLDPNTPKKGRGKRRPCRLEVEYQGQTFPLEAAHDGRNSVKWETFGGILIRYLGTTHVRGVGHDAEHDADDQVRVAVTLRVAVISWREVAVDQGQAVPKKRHRPAFRRTDRRAGKRVIQRGELE